MYTVYHSPLTADPLSLLATPPTGVIRIFTGESIAFNCAAAGTDVQLSWYRNVAPMQVNGSVLSISSARPADNGVYQCLWVSDTLQSHELATWALVVTDPGVCV